MDIALLRLRCGNRQASKMRRCGSYVLQYVVVSELLWARDRVQGSHPAALRQPVLGAEKEADHVGICLGKGELHLLGRVQNDSYFDTGQRVGDSGQTLGHTRYQGFVADHSLLADLVSLARLKHRYGCGWERMGV